jgi:hypothetical protein
MSIRTTILFVTLAALFVGLPSGPAIASHGATTLDASPETQSKEANTAGEDGTAEITAESSSPLILAPSGPNVDFEIESGPGDKDGNTPRSPDMTCDIGPLILTTCSVEYTAPTRGIDIVRVWFDHDGDDETVEYDNDEGVDETVVPGFAEPDITDVVTVNWTQGPVVKLDCDDRAGDDAEKYFTSEEPQYTCKASDAGNVGLEGIRIDGENLSSNGVNDPEAQNADYDNICTTGGDGKCVATIPTQGDNGTADLCFWTDSDNDNVYDPLSPVDPEDDEGNIIRNNDGGDCDGEKFDEAENNDQTDVVRPTWERETVAPVSTLIRPKRGVTYQQNAIQQFQATATDQHSSVGLVQFALRKYLKSGKCANWNGSKFITGSCTLRIWNNGTFDTKGTSDPADDQWVYNLSARMNPSTAGGYQAKDYVVLSRAWDDAGNIESTFTNGRNRNVFEVAPSPA